MTRFSLPILFLALGLTLAQGQTSVIDWDNETWTDPWSTGNPISQTFNLTGVDLTLTLERGPNTGAGEVGNAATLPQSTNTPISDGPGGDNSLLVDIDYNTRATNTNYANASNDFITYTMSFSAPVEEVSFELWDIDLGNDSIFFGIIQSRFQDIILFDPNGPDFTATPLGTDAEVFTTDDGIDGIRGRATNNQTNLLGNENDLNGEGNVAVTFRNSDNSKFTSVSFRYLSGDGTRNSTNISFASTNPTAQRIALHDITVIVPEPATALSALLLLGFIALQRRPPRS